jgi:hypothetical protein
MRVGGDVISGRLLTQGFANYVVSVAFETANA